MDTVHKVIVNACTEDNGEGTCYPLYGFSGSGTVESLRVDKSSWDSEKNGYVRFTPGQNYELMIDTSLTYYKSLYVILDDGSKYPGICWVNSASLTNLKTFDLINFSWPQVVNQQKVDHGPSEETEPTHSHHLIVALRLERLQIIK